MRSSMCLENTSKNLLDLKVIVTGSLKEAEKRGLSNNKKTPEALKVKIADKTIKLFEDLGVMNKVEKWKHVTKLK